MVKVDTLSAWYSIVILLWARLDSEQCPQDFTMGWKHNSLGTLHAARYHPDTKLQVWYVILQTSPAPRARMGGGHLHEARGVYPILGVATGTTELRRKRDRCSAQRRTAQMPVAAQRNHGLDHPKPSTWRCPRATPKSSSLFWDWNHPWSTIPSRPYHYNCVDEPNVASGKDCRLAGVC